MGRKLGSTKTPLRVEWVYLALREASVLAGVSRNQAQRWVATGKLCPYLVGRDGKRGRSRALYRLDEVVALKESDRR